MNRSQLAQDLRAEGFTEEQAVAAVIAVFEIIAATLAQGEPVTIRGFGRFEPRVRKRTQRLVPSTGKVVSTPKRTYIRFISSEALKARVNQPKNKNGP